MKTINQLVKEEIKLNKAYLSEHESIKDILRPLEGKPVNKRTLNPKRLGGFKLIPCHHGLSIWTIEGEFKHSIISDRLISISEFESSDVCHHRGALNRLEQLEKLDAKKLDSIYKKLNKCFQELKFLFGDLERENLGSFHNPVYYEMLRQISPDDKHIRFTDFYFMREYRK